MKTTETLDMEKTLYSYCRQLMHLVVEEVTLPEGQGIVDTLSLSPEQEFTCFELKITKADFHSNAKLSFIGNYNYFVFPRHLVPEVVAEVPENIGILVFDYYEPLLAQSHRLETPGYFTEFKKPIHQPLALDREALLNRFLHSLNREVDKAKQLVTGLKHYSSQQLLQELEKRKDQERFDDLTQNAYTRFFSDIETQAVLDLNTEIIALRKLVLQQQKELWNLKNTQPKLPLSPGFAHEI